MMPDFLQRGFNRARKMFRDLFALSGEQEPSRNELRLDADEWAVKRKLGRSFFTRHITPNTRAARIASLNRAEYDLARARGWIGGPAVKRR